MMAVDLPLEPVAEIRYLYGLKTPLTTLAILEAYILSDCHR